MLDIGKAITTLRKRCGITVEELAKKAQISPQYLNKIESGAASPTMNTVEKIAAILHIDTSYLLAIAEQKFKN